MQNSFLLAKSILFVLLFNACSNLSSEINRSADIESTLMTPWTSDWGTNLSEPFQSIAIDHGVAVIARESKSKIQIQEFSSTLGLVRNVPVELEKKEEQPRLFKHNGRLLLFTTAELDDDKVRVGLRTIDKGATTTSALQEIIITPEDFDKERFLYRHSPDSSQLLVMSFGDDFDLEDAVGDNHPNYPIAAAVVNLATLTANTWIDTIQYHDEVDEDALWRDAVVSNEGEPTIVELLEVENENYQFRVIAQREGKTRLSIHNYPRQTLKEGDDPLRVSQIRAGLLSNGDVLALTRNLDDNRLHSLERIRVDKTTLNADFKILSQFNEKLVKQLTGDDLKKYSRGHFLEEVLICEDDSYIPILQQWYEKSHTNSKGRTRYSWHYDLITVLRFDASDSLAMASVIDREESWSPPPLASFEADYEVHREGKKLSFLLRQRRLDGVMLYGIDLEDPDAPIAAKLVANLGNMAYFGRRYTAWSGDGGIFLFMKAGQFGSDWQMMRVIL